MLKRSRLSSKLVLLAILCILLATFSHAQWLETTIFVPDSLSGTVLPRALTYNATNNKIYVGGLEGSNGVRRSVPGNGIWWRSSSWKEPWKALKEG